MYGQSFLGLVHYKDQKWNQGNHPDLGTCKIFQKIGKESKRQVDFLHPSLIELKVKIVVYL
ncbi:MAG: hypothetical protein FADNKDHG_01608 [Holosporales bacterium]